MATAKKHEMSSIGELACTKDSFRALLFKTYMNDTLSGYGVNVDCYAHH